MAKAANGEKLSLMICQYRALKKYNKMINYEKDRIGVEKNDYVITKFLGIVDTRRMFQA